MHRFLIKSAPRNPKIPRRTPVYSAFSQRPRVFDPFFERPAFYKILPVSKIWKICGIQWGPPANFPGSAAGQLSCFRPRDGPQSTCNVFQFKESGVIWTSTDSKYPPLYHVPMSIVPLHAFKPCDVNLWVKCPNRSWGPLTFPTLHGFRKIEPLLELTP